MSLIVERRTFDGADALEGAKAFAERRGLRWTPLPDGTHK